MSRLFRTLLFAGFVAGGSWLGLGRPSLEQARDLEQKALQRIEALARAGQRPHGLTPAESDRDRVTDLPPPPQLHDAKNASLRPWPELNPEASVQRAWMVAEGPRASAESGRRFVTLTFDDGPSPETTPKVLRELARYHVHAAFFVIGSYLDGDEPRTKSRREVLKQVVAGGHLVGNHSYDHVRLSTVTPTQALEQIDQSAEAIERVTGRRPILFRPPFGDLDDFGRNAVRERGLELVLWSIEKRDMQRSDSAEMFRELVSQIEYKGGGIVLLHDIRRSSLPALRELLVWLRDHAWDPNNPRQVGYEVVDLPTYFREVAAAPQPFETRDELERARSATQVEHRTEPSHPHRRAKKR